MGPQFDVDTLRVWCTTGEPDPPAITLADTLGDRVITAPGRTEASVRGSERGLLRRRHIGVAA